MSSLAFTRYTFDSSWAIGKPHCFDKVQLKTEVGQVL